jgi:hypothetical protein
MVCLEVSCGSDSRWTLCTPPHSDLVKSFRPEPTVIARRELVLEASGYDESAPPLESIPIGSTSSFPYHSRDLVSLDNSARIEGSAHHSLDLIPFGILLR